MWLSGEERLLLSQNSQARFLTATWRSVVCSMAWHLGLTWDSEGMKEKQMLQKCDRHVDTGQVGCVDG